MLHQLTTLHWLQQNKQTRNDCSATDWERTHYIWTIRRDICALRVSNTTTCAHLHSIHGVLHAIDIHRLRSITCAAATWVATHFLRRAGRRGARMLATALRFRVPPRARWFPAPREALQVARFALWSSSRCNRYVFWWYNGTALFTIYRVTYHHMCDDSQMYMFAFIHFSMVHVYIHLFFNGLRLHSSIFQWCMFMYIYLLMCSIALNVLIACNSKWPWVCNGTFVDNAWNIIGTVSGTRDPIYPWELLSTLLLHSLLSLPVRVCIPEYWLDGTSVPGLQ